MEVEYPCILSPVPSSPDLGGENSSAICLCISAVHPTLAEHLLCAHHREGCQCLLLSKGRKVCEWPWEPGGRVVHGRKSRRTWKPRC